MFETAFKYQYPNQTQRPIRYILPGNLKQKYNEIPQFEQILRSTQKCPFTSIRQLLISFRRNDPFDHDVPLCDILREKYVQNHEYQEIQNKLNTTVKQVQQTSIRTQKLFACLEEYALMYRQLSEGKVNFQTTQKVIRNKNKQLVNSGAINDIYKKDYEYCELQNQYFKFVTYSQEIQRALVLVAASQSHRIKANSNMAKLDNLRQFSDAWKNIRTMINKRDSQATKCLFAWRQTVKHQIVDEGTKSRCLILVKDWEHEKQQIDIGYNQMSEFPSWFERDRRQMRSLYQRRSASYRQFLPEFIRFSESQYIQSQSTIYHDVILQQKNLLQAHLKKNYGLVVPYTPSQPFNKTIAPIQRGDKSHLKMLLNDKLAPLQDGILYLNGEYEKLYKKVCESRDPQSCMRDIQKWINKFSTYSQSAENKFANHLVESCQRLLRLMK